MHFYLKKYEFVIFLILILTITTSLWQIYSHTKQLNVHTEQTLASAAYYAELLKFNTSAREEQNKTRGLHNKKSKKVLETQKPFNTIESQTAANTKNLYEKLLVIDLANMELQAYRDGELMYEAPVLSKGREGSRWETPAGLYSVTVKKLNHISSIAGVNLPYSMPFFGNFFIHGWPTYTDGTDVPKGFSGGCIRLSTKDAKNIYRLVDVGTKVLIINHTKYSAPDTDIYTMDVPLPNITADSYLVADVLTGKIYASKNINRQRSIASITKLLTALTANAFIRYDKNINLVAGSPISTKDYKQFPKGIGLKATDSVYPLLMESNNAVAHAVARSYGTKAFISKVMRQVNALGMSDTQIADASGISAQNISTAKDLFKLARYLYNNSQFILNVTKTKSKSIYADGNKYNIRNYNHFADSPNFIGGKTGYTRAAGETMLSIFNVNIGGKERPVAIIILGSNERKNDIVKLYSWFNKYAYSAKMRNTISTKGSVTHIAGPKLRQTSI